MRNRPQGGVFRGTVWVTLVLTLLLVASAGAPVVGAARARTADDIGAVSTEYSGPGIALKGENTTYVWQDGQTDLRVTAYPTKSRAGQSYEVCLTLEAPGNTTYEKGCKEGTFRTYGTQETFTIETLGTNKTGHHELVVTLTAGGDNVTRRVPIEVIERGGDLDGDGLTNEREIEIGTNISGTDTDGDGLQDGPEVNEYGTSPLQADTDGDGAPDAVEIQNGIDPINDDTDDDGLTDGEELGQYNTNPTLPDTDGDGLSDKQELEGPTDPTNPDTDGDGRLDGDEVANGTDPVVANTPTPGAAPGTGGGPVDTPSGSGIPTSLWVGLGLLVVVGAAVVYTQRDRKPATPDAAAAAAPASEDVDVDLLSPEQHVLHLLETNGGQLKQSDIVDLTDWSKAKVSRTLGSMEEDGRIERVRIGRENLVTTPGNTPEEN